MTEAERIAIEHACTRLMVRYCHLVDSYSHVDLVELFAQDGVWDGVKGPLKGHDAIRGYLDAKAPSYGRHHVTNMLVDVKDHDHAEGSCYFTFYTAPGHKGDGPAPSVAPTVMGRYVDKYVRAATGWRIAHRKMVIEFRPG